MENPVLAIADMVIPDDNMNAYRPLFEGNQGWRASYVQPGDRNQAHHYAAFVYMGFMGRAELGYVANFVRDGLCNCSPLQKSPEDLALGNLASIHGDLLLTDQILVQNFGSHMYMALKSVPVSGGGYD